LAVRLAAQTVEICDGSGQVARHERAVGRYVEVFALDHYLEVLKTSQADCRARPRRRRPKAEAHSPHPTTPAGNAVRHACGDIAGTTRALIEILLAHRTMPAAYESLVRLLDARSLMAYMMVTTER
jgi:hypothetical protein